VPSGEKPCERENTEHNRKLHTNCAEVRAKHVQCVRALSTPKTKITPRLGDRRVITKEHSGDVNRRKGSNDQHGPMIDDRI
jgi:hypothetical protein